MKSVVRVIRKWSFLWILGVMGAGMLTATDSWAAVREPGQNAVTALVALFTKEDILDADGSGAGEEGQEVSPGESGQENEPADGENPGAGSESGVEENAKDSSEDSSEDGSAGDAGEGAEKGTDNDPENEAGSNPDEGTGSGTGSDTGSDTGTDTGTGDEPDSGETVVGRDPSEVVYTAVEDDYFADAVFIGDSRTVGLFEYGGLEETATFYASTGLTIFDLFEAKIVSVPGSLEKITIEQALSENHFGKIYLMVGINEMGTGDLARFLEAYGQVVEHLKELQPDAIIYLQGIIKVTAERSAQGDYITNEGIVERNAGIEELADYVTVYYLDVNPVVCDEEGNLNPDYTTDGVHLKARYMDLWKNFLKEHAVTLD